MPPETLIQYGSHRISHHFPLCFMGVSESSYPPNNHYWLVVLEHFFIFPYTNWEESSQLTFIFFRGVGQPPTRLWAREVMMNRRSSRPLFETRPRYSRVSGAWSDVAAVEWRWPWGRARPNGKTGWVYTVEDQQLEYGKIKLPCLTWVQDISVFICCWVALIHT